MLKYIFDKQLPCDSLKLDIYPYNIYAPTHLLSGIRNCNAKHVKISNEVRLQVWTQFLKEYQK